MTKAGTIKTGKKWTYRNSKSNFSTNKLSNEIVGILSARGVSSEQEAMEFLNPDYGKLKDPFELKDMSIAVDVIKKAVDSNKKITIYGDYDVDGITATALLVNFFNEIGVSADYYIPSRQTEGYGLNKEAIDRIAESGTDLIITVDCGSTSMDEIAYANEKGIQIIVTDHHSLKQENTSDVLPAAVALINPRRRDSEYKQELSGVGVAFCLVRALQTVFKSKLPNGQEKWLLDLVALGTICDVVPLIGDNRILAYFGLKVLAKSKRPGIKALAAVSGFELKNIEAYHVGFLLGPRLNAAGRLETASKSLELLLSKNEVEAQKIAHELDEINKERQELTERILEEAREMVSGISDGRKIYLLAKEDWPAGVVGIVASRLVDEFGRPMLIMEDLGEELKGSARSIKAFNIIEALTKCSDSFSHFGGHAFAAGFSLSKEHFVLLEEKLISICENEINEEDLNGEIVVDEKIALKNVTESLIEEIKKLEPFGQGNPKPVFVLKGAEIKEMRFVGNPAIHLKLTLENEGSFISGMIFNNGEDSKLKVGDKVDVALSLEENVWRDKKSIEFRALDIKPSE